MRRGGLREQSGLGTREYRKRQCGVGGFIYDRTEGGAVGDVPSFTYQRVAGEAIFEIGRRLKHVRDDMKYGDYTPWLETIGMDRRRASEFIKVYDEFNGEDVRTFGHLGLRALYEIATMPEESREQPHTIPSTGAIKTIDEMTVRELREVKKALREAEEAKAEAEQRAKQAEAQRDTAARSEEILRRQLEAAYITETKLNRDDLKSGQKAAIVIRLFHELGVEHGKERMSEGGKTKVSPIGETIDTHGMLAKKAGVGKSNMYYLLAVYKNRPDLFELVFNGDYSINKAYTEMKRDEAPETVEEVAPQWVIIAKLF